jgi:CHAT domain-containing protein/tetratricopeptide (TPR) repeat protein
MCPLLCNFSSDYKPTFIYIMRLLKSFKIYIGFTIIFLITGNIQCFSSYNFRQDTVIANVFFEKAKLLEDSAQYDTTISYYEKAAEIYKANKLWVRHIECKNGIIYQLLENKPDKDLQILAWKNIDLATKNLGSTHYCTGDCYSVLGDIFSKHEMVDSAFQHFSKAMQIWKHDEKNLQLRISKAHHNLAKTYSDKGEADLAILNYNKALNILFNHKEKYQTKIADIYNDIGVMYYYSEQLDSCLHYYINAFEILKIHYGPNHTKLTGLYNNIGLIYDMQGKYSEAIEYYNKAIDISLEKTPNDPSLVLYYNNIAICYKNTGEIEKAEEFYSKGLKLSQITYGENHYYSGIFLKNIGSLYTTRGDYEKALEYKKKGANIMINHFGEQNPNSANAYETLGIAFSNVNKLDTALQFFNKSLQLKLKTGVINTRTARSYNNIGATYKFMGDYELAKYYYERSINIHTNIMGEDHIDNIPSLNNLGEIFFLKGETDTAIYYFEKNVNIIIENLGNNHSHLSRAYLNLGAAYNESDQYSKSLDCYFKALKIIENTYGRQHPTYINICINLTHTFNNIGKSDSAIYYSKKAVKNAELVYPDKHPEIAKTYETMGWIYSKTEQPDSAIVYFENAIKSNYLSDELLDNKNLNVQFIIDEIIFIETLDRYSGYLIRLYYETSNEKYLSNAILFSQISLETINSVLLNFNLEESKITLMAKSANIIQNGLEAAWEYYNITNDEKYKSLAFQFSEQNKATILYKSLLKNRITDVNNQNDSIQIYRKELQNKINALKIKILLDNVELVQKDILKTDLFETVVKYNNLDDNIQPTGHKNITNKIASTISVDSIRQHLMPNEIIIEYSLTDSVLFCFIIGNELFEWQRISIGKDFKKEINDYLLSIKKNRLSNFKNLSYQLYEYLIQPIEKYISEDSKLVFIPDKELISLPFESIITKKSEIHDNKFSSANYLLKKHEIAYSYSCALWVENHRDVPVQSENENSIDFIGFAPVFSEDSNVANIPSVNNDLMLSYLPDSLLRSITLNGIKYNELPFSKSEVENIAQIFNKNKKEAEFYLFSEASEENFKKLSSNAKIIHVATHGILNNEYAELSGLLFFLKEEKQEELNDTLTDKLRGYMEMSNDGILFVKEIYGLNLIADLVVLSACETGSGKFIEGEGIISLTRGFLYSGAKNLLVSLWKVGDESTKDLMVNFYNNLTQGNSKSAALRNAKLELINNDETAFPKFWSGFVLIGAD